MYKGFALAILLAAPILVMLVDSIAPKQATAPVVVATSTQAGSSKPGVSPALVSQTPPSQDFTATAGLPISDAGKPMLDLSNPSEQSAAAPVIDSAPAAPSQPAGPTINPDAQRNQPAPGASLTAEWRKERR